MGHSKLNLPPFFLPKDRVIPQGMLERFSRTIADWSRGLDSLVSTSHSTPFTPQLQGSVSNPALGADGTAVGLWTAVGNDVLYQYAFTFAGAGIAQGSGSLLITVPLKPKGTTGLLTSHGLTLVRDDSTATECLFATPLNATHAYLRFMHTNPAAYGISTNVTAANVGLTFAAGDTINGQIAYHSGALSKF